MVESSSASGTMLKLRSCDGHELQALLEAMKQNRFFADMLEEGDVPSEAISLSSPHLTKANLEQIIEYCLFAYKNNPPRI